jgi:hypothetical protein
MNVLTNDISFAFVMICVFITFLIVNNGIKKQIKECKKPNKVTISGVLRYPSEIICPSCGKHVFPIAGNICYLTWDLSCKQCDTVAYKHPQREERRQQILDMLDL